MKKKILIISAVVLLCVPFILSGGEKEEAGLKIGFAPSTYELTDYYGQASAALQEILKKEGVDFEFIDRAPEKEADVTAHLSIIDDLITLGVDYLIIGPSQFFGVVPGIQKANKAGIPVLVCGNLGPYPEDTGVDVLSYFGEDNYLGGQVTGEYVWEKGYLKPGEKFALIKAEPGNQKSEDRASAEVIWQERGAILAYTDYAGWEMDRAYTATERMLVGYPDLKVIYGNCSAHAMGAAQAIAVAGKTEDINVFGFGCITSELDMIYEGLITASGFRDAASSGRDMAKSIIKHINGEEVPKAHPLDFVMIDTGDDIINKIPPHQQTLMENWPLK